MSKLTTILHVDDDADMRAVVQVALRDLGGFDVRQARDGAEAVEMADESRPDLIILDMMMPRIDGRETLAAIHRLPGELGGWTTSRDVKPVPDQTFREWWRERRGP